MLFNSFKCNKHLTLKTAMPCDDLSWINTDSDKHKHTTVRTDQTMFTKAFSSKWNYGRPTWHDQGSNQKADADTALFRAFMLITVCVDPT